MTNSGDAPRISGRDTLSAVTHVLMLDLVAPSYQARRCHLGDFEGEGLVIACNPWCGVFLGRKWVSCPRTERLLEETYPVAWRISAVAGPGISTRTLCQSGRIANVE